jgi:hypothetical protein
MCVNFETDKKRKALTRYTLRGARNYLTQQKSNLQDT